MTQPIYGISLIQLWLARYDCITKPKMNIAIFEHLTIKKGYDPVATILHFATGFDVLSILLQWYKNRLKCPSQHHSNS